MTKEKRIFYPHKYYVVDTDNTIIFEGDSIEECKHAAIDSDMILVCLPASGKRIVKEVQDPKPSKVIFDFDKNLLTIEGGSVTIDNVVYKTGTYEIKDWWNFTSALNRVYSSVEYIGKPVIPEARDITDEMSDM